MNHTQLTEGDKPLVAKLATVTRGAIFSVLLIASAGVMINIATPAVTTAATQQIVFVEVERSSPPIEVNPKEQRCLAANIYFEARNQSDLGQLAVGIVTLNRARSEQWADTICGVVYEPRQFSWTHDKKQRRYTEDELAYLKALNLASKLLNGEFDAMLDMFPADHYHKRTVNPDWARRFERVAVVQDHIFYSSHK